MSVIEVQGSANAPITEAELLPQGAERPVEVIEDADLKMVVQDAQLAEAWLGQKQWGMYWQEADILYQAPRNATAWENSNVTRASVSRFTVAKHQNSLVPTMMSGIFYDTPPFVLRPRPATTQATTRAWTSLIAALLEEMEFKIELERGVDSQVLNGTGVFKWGCCTEKKIETHYRRKKAPIKTALPFAGEREVPTAESDEFDVVEEEVTKWRPFFEHRPLGQVLISSAWRHSNQLWRAPFVIDRQYVTFEDLNKLRGQDGYDIPSEEELKKIFFPPAETTKTVGQVESQLNNNIGAVHHAAPRDEKHSSNPLLTPLKLDERWDKDRVVAVLQDKLVIRRALHMLGRIPFLAANFWNIQNAGYGLGIGRLIGTEQRVETGSINAALDILSLAVNPQYAVSEGANVQTQNIRARLGGIIKVSGKVGEGFSVVEQPQVPGDVWRVIQESKQSAESMTGADEAMVQGTVPGKGSSVTRTATGAGNVAAAAATRIQGPVGRLVDGVLVPFIYALMSMVKERMPIAQIRAILTDELGPDFELDLDNFMEARLRAEVLAGAHLAAKKAMAQSLPFLIQIFENQHITEQLNKTGWIIDIQEVLDMLMEMSEWKNQRQVIRRMKPDEMEMFKSMNPALAQVMGKMKEIEAKHAATTEEIDQKTTGRLAEKVTMNALDRAAAHEDQQTAERALESHQPQGHDTPQFSSTRAM
jgi:hypothetical protein